jgi:CrcB protein
MGALALFGKGFPWGTLAVNALGSLGAGFALGLSERALLDETTRLALMTGFLGGFTTFSALAVDSATYLLGDSRWLGAVNLAGNAAAGLALCWVGIALSRRIL